MVFVVAFGFRQKKDAEDDGEDRKRNGEDAGHEIWPILQASPTVRQTYQ
jgi:hypothetical protein